MEGEEGSVIEVECGAGRRPSPLVVCTAREFFNMKMGLVHFTLSQYTMALLLLKISRSNILGNPLPAEPKQVY